MLHGPGLNFSSSVQNSPIQFGPCPLVQGPCTQGDILMQAPEFEIDHCLHGPCMGGTCISLTDTYEVHPKIKKYIHILIF